MKAPTLLDYLIGFDPDIYHTRGLWDNDPNYPPFNTYSEGENTILEFALAGYSKDNIDVIVENSILRVSANKEKKTNIENYGHRGIALRSFNKKFALSEHAVVQKAEYKDGMLRITIATIVPEEKKPRKITIES